MKDPFKKLSDTFRQKRELTKGKKLSKKRGSLTGVCAGIGDYLDTDPLIIRAGFVVFTYFVPIVGIVGYLGLSYFLPKDEAEEWDSVKYTYEEYENMLEEKEFMWKEDPLPTTNLLPVCPDCDTVAKPNSKFCHKCGTKI